MKGGSKIKPGIYKHYKGGLYKVLFIARHSETLEEMVVYEHVEKSADKYWVRPLSMFKESVLVDGKKVRRFTLIK